MIYVEDEQLMAFTPRLDNQFRERCIEMLAARGKWSQDRLARAVDTALERARTLGLSEERSVLAYIVLATDIVLARPDEHIVRAVESILGEKRLAEWQRVLLAEDFFRQMHRSRP